jgi:hypothetical protein
MNSLQQLGLAALAGYVRWNRRGEHEHVNPPEYRELLHAAMHLHEWLPEALQFR